MDRSSKELKAFLDNFFAEQFKNFQEMHIDIFEEAKCEGALSNESVSQLEDYINNNEPFGDLVVGISLLKILQPGTEIFLQTWDILTNWISENIQSNDTPLDWYARRNDIGIFEMRYYVRNFIRAEVRKENVFSVRFDNDENLCYDPYVPTPLKIKSRIFSKKIERDEIPEDAENPFRVNKDYNDPNLEIG